MLIFTRSGPLFTGYIKCQKHNEKLDFFCNHLCNENFKDVTGRKQIQVKYDLNFQTRLYYTHYDFTLYLNFDLNV